MVWYAFEHADFAGSAYAAHAGIGRIHAGVEQRAHVGGQFVRDEVARGRAIIPSSTIDFNPVTTGTYAGVEELYVDDLDGVLSLAATVSAIAIDAPAAPSTAPHVGDASLSWPEQVGQGGEG